MDSGQPASTLHDLSNPSGAVSGQLSKACSSDADDVVDDDHMQSHGATRRAGGDRDHHR